MANFSKIFIALISGSLVAGVGGFVSPSFSQSIIPAQDGTGTVITPQNNQFNITGGSVSADGANLFHSFSQFNLSPGQIANFISNPNILNILGRINDGNPSYINGLIQVTGGNSQLFLMNPAGVVFGANASLNVPSSFAATTATGIGFNNGFFNAFGVNNYAALVGNPSAFNFAVPQPGSIVNAGNLNLKPENNLILVGGNVINTGILSSPGGNVSLTAVPGNNSVTIIQQGRILSLEIVPNSLPVSTPITPLSLPQLLTGPNTENTAQSLIVNENGDVVLVQKNIVIPRDSRVNVAPGNINVLSPSINGNISILGNNVEQLNAPTNLNPVPINSQPAGEIPPLPNVPPPAPPASINPEVPNPNNTNNVPPPAPPASINPEVSNPNNANSTGVLPPPPPPSPLPSPSQPGNVIQTITAVNYPTNINPTNVLPANINPTNVLPINGNILTINNLGNPGNISINPPVNIGNGNPGNISINPPVNLPGAGNLPGKIGSGGIRIPRNSNGEPQPRNSNNNPANNQIIERRNQPDKNREDNPVETVDKTRFSELANLPTPPAPPPAINIKDAISSIERNRSQEYNNFFGNQGSFQSVSVENLRDALGKIVGQTGNRTAIIYVTALSNELELILYTPEGEPLRVTVAGVGKENLLQTASKFTQSITDAVKRNSSGYLGLSQQLYKWIIAPLEQELVNAKINTLLFSMDSGLRSLPMAALHDGKEFLVEKYSLGLVPSISLMDARYQNIQNSPVLAMGASEFTELSSLPAVPVELKTITTEQGGKAFLNENFTRENIISQRLANAYQIVHLATHAEFTAGDANNSYIQLWDEKLRFNEIRSLRFNQPPVELLVLSACKTAVGDEKAELGFAGLAIGSGVKSALASLWYVSDEGTLGLMSEFYKQLENVPIKAEALRQAQLAMLHGQVRIENGQLRGTTSRGTIALPAELSKQQSLDLSHPYFWSGFTMIGSPW
ncbi:MAG TPA: CHAT domain-containing protein [Halomicronema sp.]